MFNYHKNGFAFLYMNNYIQTYIRYLNTFEALHIFEIKNYVYNADNMY